MEKETDQNMFDDNASTGSNASQGSSLNKDSLARLKALKDALKLASSLSQDDAALTKILNEDPDFERSILHLTNYEKKKSEKKETKSNAFNDLGLLDILCFTFLY